MTDREIMQQALDAMERYQVKSGDFDRFDNVIKNLRQALAQPKYRRGDRLLCLESEEYCVIHISGTNRQYVEFPDSHIAEYMNEQVQELFELIPKETDQALAQPEQEEPLPLVDIGVDVTPEGTHVVACYNRPDAVQEMFYSQFHPLTKPQQEPVCDKDPFYCWSIRCQVGKVCKHTAPPKRAWAGLTDDEIDQIAAEVCFGYIDVARAIEAKLKERNT